MTHEYKPNRQAGKKGSMYDDCQTPPYAVEPLMPFLRGMDRTVYDPAEGNGVLKRAIEAGGLGVVGSDIKTGKDFFSLRRDQGVDSKITIVTNPPYSIKYEWLSHCFQLGDPFALLMPVEVLGSSKAQNMMETYGLNFPMHVVFTQPRVDFCMPYQMWSGNGAQFPVAWFTWKIPLPRQLTFAKLNKPKKAHLALYWMDALQIDNAKLVTPWFKESKVVFDTKTAATERMSKDVRSWNGVDLLEYDYEWGKNGECRVWYEIERIEK
jgi:hypothetical protein